MFEDSLFASKVAGRPARSRWAAVVAVVVQGASAAGLLVMPMLHPLALPMLATAPAVVSVKLRKPEVKVEPVKVRQATTSSDLSVRAPIAAPVMQMRGGGRISAPDTSAETGPLVVAMGPGMGSGVGPALGAGSGVGEVASPVVRVKSVGPVRVSSGVSSGMLLGGIHAVYPAIARAAGVSGTVVVSARIDKAGRIVGAVIVSGPGMLRSAALEPVEAARYRPYLLNGEPTEVETTIVVNFRMGG